MNILFGKPSSLAAACHHPAETKSEAPPRRPLGPPLRTSAQWEAPQRCGRPSRLSSPITCHGLPPPSCKQISIITPAAAAECHAHSEDRAVLGPRFSEIFRQRQ